MSLGANFSSGYTANLQNTKLGCGTPSITTDPCIPCKTESPGPHSVAQYPSMALLGNVCRSPTVEEFVLYPKVAVPSSIRTQGIIDKVTQAAGRFSQYRRYTPPVPCPPLPPSMAGISRPSDKGCD
jgi:hypothetical protein